MVTLHPLRRLSSERRQNEEKVETDIFIAADGVLLVLGVAVRDEFL